MIGVLVVHDQELVRESLRRLLQAEGDMNVLARGGAGALDGVRDSAPDVVLLDAMTPGPGGLALLAAIRALPGPPPVAVLSAPGAVGEVEAAVRLGAAGFLLEDSAPALLAHALRVLAVGGVICTPGVSRAVLAHHLMGRPGSPPAEPLPGLTRREREVLALVAAGLPNAGIAGRLGVGVTTVKTYITALKRKLSAPNRVALAMIAHRAGLTWAAPDGLPVRKAPEGAVATLPD